MFIGALLLQGTTFVAQAHGDDIKFSLSTVKLPIGVSDMTATYVPDFKGTGAEAILLTGGCSSENGNEKVVEEKDGVDITNFYCMDITSRAFVFYPSTQNIVEVCSYVFIYVFI